MKENFREKILKNGMTVLFEKREVPVVSVAFAVRQGGINERGNEKGISHYIEHMLYKGTKKRSAKKISEEIERNGGMMNGFTDEMITAFWCKMPSKHVNVALDVLSDMMKNSLFNEKELEKERKVIFEEIKMRKDNPMIYVFDRIHSLLYEKPFGIPIIGTFETMNSISREKITRKFKEVYQPNNMILCVVGDADFEKIVKFAEKNFGNKKIIAQASRVKTRNELQTERRKGIDQTHLVFAYHVPLANDKKSHAANVLSVLMAEGMSSRLFREIREKRNLAYAVKGDAEICRNFAYNFIYLGIRKENLEKVKKLVLEEFEKVSENLGEKELKSVKEQMTGNNKISMEDSQNQMMNLLSHEINGRAEDFYDFEKNILNVKLKDVKEIAKKAREEYSFFALVPE
ncbi:MAG: pitrilysin family protein [archaeon]